MPKKNSPHTPSKPKDQPVILPPIDTDEPVLPDNTHPDIIPDENEFETPPYEAPEPGEGP